MSRRRFGDADDTYKDFISAIDDHKRKRERQMRQQQQAAAAASVTVTPPPPSSGGSLNFGGPPPLHPYASILSDESSQASGGFAHDRGNNGSGGVGGGSGGGSGASGYEEFLAEELPIGATERDPLVPDAYRYGGGGGSGAGATSSRLRQFEEERTKGSSEPNPGDHVWLTKRNLDLTVQKKSIWIFANGMFGVALMCLILEVCWDPTWQANRFDGDMSIPSGYYNDLNWVTARKAMTPDPIPTGWSWAAVEGQCPSPTRSIAIEILKLVLVLSTLLLCWQLLDRKRMQVNIRLREQRRKLKAKGETLFLPPGNSASDATLFSLLSLSRSHFRSDVWCSLLVCLIQPMPFTNQLTGGWFDDKIGMLMWARIFLMFRVVRDCSEIWLSRRSIKQQFWHGASNYRLPELNWWLSLKTICYRRPLFFAGCFWALCTIIFGHCLYIAEREYLPAYFTLGTSLFVSVQIVSVGWPADVWEIWMPITSLGKTVSLIAGVSGLILISFVIVTVGSALHPSRFEEDALNFIAMERVRQKEREGSAELIQFVWKNAAREAELEAKLAPKNPALYDEISAAEDKVFMETFLAKSKALRSIRRERAELEERSDPTSEKNISPMDQYFDTKLEAIRTDIQQTNVRNQQQLMNMLAILNQISHKVREKEKQKQAAQQPQPTQPAGAQGQQTGGAGGGGSSRKQRQRASMGAIPERKTGAGAELTPVGIASGSDAPSASEQARPSPMTMEDEEAFRAGRRTSAGVADFPPSIELAAQGTPRTSQQLPQEEEQQQRYDAASSDTHHSFDEGQPAPGE